jgi:LPS O-antigen subunit length determinant protein (WzzB/FepE family)
MSLKEDIKMDGKTQETVVEGQNVEGKEDTTVKQDGVVEEPTAEKKLDDPKGEKTTNVDLDKAIAEAREQAIEEYKQQLEEQKRKEKLSPEELKAEEDAKKEKRISELEHELMVRNCKDNAIKTLDEKNLPVALAGCLNYESEETAQKSLDTVSKVFTECLEEELKNRLKGRTPTGLNANNDINSTADTQAKIYAQMSVKTEKK